MFWMEAELQSNLAIFGIIKCWQIIATKEMWLGQARLGYGLKQVVVRIAEKLEENSLLRDIRKKKKFGKTFFFTFGAPKLPQPNLNIQSAVPLSSCVVASTEGATLLVGQPVPTALD